MPPTPEQLQITESAQLTPQQPQVSAVPARANYVEEGVVSMPSPQMWMGGVDPGDNWWNLGSNAAKAGMDIYKSVNDGLLASRRQNAENDMNNLQNISLEKPESPDMTPYQLKEWQQGQQRKLNNATYNSLVNQGLSDEDARGVLDGTKNPAGFKMYASDIQNILHLTRYQGQTNASMVNDIQRYDNIAFENSTTNFQHSNNNQWNASNSTLDQVIKNYKNTTDDLFHTSGLTQEQINNPDTSKLSKLQQDRHSIINYLTKTSNYDKSIKQALTRQTTEFSESFGKTQKQLAISNFSGIISDEDYINKSFDSYEKLMNDNKTISKLMQSSHTVDSQAVIDGISKQKLQENPSLTVGIAVNQTQSLNVEIGKLQEILTQPNISYQESIILKDEISKRVIKQNKIADEIVTHLPGVDLSPTMKAYYDNFNSMVGKNKQALALQNLQKINSQAASDVQLIVSGMDREIENNFDMLLQFRQHTKRTMTQPEFLQMYKTTEEKLSPTVKLLYNILPANQDTNSPLNVVEDKNLRPLIHTMIRNQVADQFGLTRKDNVIIPTNEIESELTKIIVQGKIGSNTNASSVEAAVSVTNNDGQTRGELSKQKKIESTGNNLSMNSPGTTPEDIREAAPTAIKDLLTQKAFTRGSVEILMAADGRKDTEMVSVMRQTPQNLEAAMSLFIEHPEYFDRAKIMDANRKRSLLLKTTTSATPGVNLESVEFMRDFQNFALTKMASADGNSYIAEAKQDPKIMAAEFTTMMSRKEKAQAGLLTNVRNAVATNGGTTSDISGSVSSYFSGHSALTAASFTDMLRNSPMGADAAFPIYKEYMKNVLGDSHEGSEWYWFGWMSDWDLENNTETMIKLSQAGDDDIFGPILTALWSADATSTPQSVLYEAQQMHQLGGHSFKKRVDINGKQRFVASTDLQNLTTVDGTNAAIPGYNIDPVVNPVQLMGQTYDSIVIGQLQNGLKKDGLPYVPSDFTEQQKYTPNKEDYKDIARSFFNGSVTKANLEGDTSSMLVIDGLTEAFSGSSTPKSRLALLKDPNNKLSKWVDLTAGTSGTNEIRNSRERWVSRVLSQPYLTGKSAVEIGLNSRSWIGFEKAGNMTTQIEARFRSLDEYQGTWATESQHKENLGPQLGDTSTRTADGISFIDPSRGTEVIPNHPLTGAEMRMPQSYSARFKAAANQEAYSKLSKNWVNENRGATWKFWDLDGHKFIETQVGSSDPFGYKLTSQNGMISGSKYQDRYNIQHFNLLPIQMIKPSPYIPITRTNDFNGKPVASAPVTPASVTPASVESDAISPGAVSGNAEDKMAKIIAEDNATNVPEFVRNKPTAFEDQQRYWKNVDDKFNTAKQELLTMFNDNSKLQKWLNNYIKPTIEDLDKFADIGKKPLHGMEFEPEPPLPFDQVNGIENQQRIAKLYSFRDKMINLFHLNKADNFTAKSRFIEVGKDKNGKVINFTHDEIISIAETMYKNGIFSESELDSIKFKVGTYKFYDTKEDTKKIEQAKVDPKQEIDQEQRIKDRAENKPQQDKIDKAAKQELLTMFDNDSSKESKVTRFYNKAKQLGMAYDEDHPDTYLDENDSLNIVEILYKNNTLTKEEYITIKEQLKERQGVRNNAISDYQEKEFKKNKRG